MANPRSFANVSHSQSFPPYGTHGKALRSVMGELASKLIHELMLVASVFSKFKFVESSNTESFSQPEEGDYLVARISESGIYSCHDSRGAITYCLFRFRGGLKLTRGPLLAAKIIRGSILAGTEMFVIAMLVRR